MFGFAVMVILVLLCLEKYSIDNALTDVSYNITPSKILVDPDERFTITTEITNAKKMVVPYLSVTENFPPCIDIHGEGYHTSMVLDNDMSKKKRFVIRDIGEAFRTLSYTTYLKSKSILRRDITVSMPKRGRYFFSGATVNGGDFLGFSESVESFPLVREIVVLPKRIAMDAVSDAVGGFLGDVSVNRFIMEDPILTLGYAEYTGREPQRAISWVQSAKMNRMMVKKYDYTLEPCIMVLLNVERGTSEQIESCFSIGRTICEDLEAKGITYSFLTNAIGSDEMGIRSFVPEGLGNGHLYSILENLGRASSSSCAEKFADMMDRAYDYAEIGCSLVLVTPQRRPEEEELLQRFSAMKGGRTSVYSAEEVS